MVVSDGVVGMTRDELNEIKATGRFHVIEHTPTYMNGVYAQANGITIGFYNWLHGLDCYVSSGGTDEFSDSHEFHVTVESDEHLKAILAAMDALMVMARFGKPSTAG